MSGGFVSGVFWGVVVSGTCLVIASQSDKVVDLSPEPVAVEASVEEADTGAVDAPPTGAASDTADVPSGDAAATPPAEAADTPPGDEADPTVSDTPDAAAVGAAEPASDAPSTDEADTEPAVEEQEAAPATQEESRNAEPEPATGAEPVADVASNTPEEPASTGEATSPVIEAASSDTTVAAATDLQQPATASAQEADTDAPPVIVMDAPNTIREPVGEIGDLAANVTTNRLPRIGAQEDPTTEAMAPAIDRNAVPFEAASGTPLLAIVLIDTGADRPDLQVLQDFPVPLSIAVDPLLPDADEVAASYRAVGLEVAVLTPLADGATPADVAEAFDVFLATVPQAVAVMDLPQALLQQGRPRASQVATILAKTGHGLISYNSGLNSGIQIAEGDGIPAKLVFRVFDDGTQDLAAMRMALDNSVLGAGQQGAAILVGQARAETLQAVAEWALGTRGASVTPAPVSAVLKM